MKIDDQMRSGSQAHCVSLGIAVDYWSQPAKVGRQFQQAEALGSVYAVVVGPEWPQVRVKHLAERSEEMISTDELPALLGNK